MSIYATSRKVPASIPSVIGFLNRHLPSIWKIKIEVKNDATMHNNNNNNNKLPGLRPPWEAFSRLNNFLTFYGTQRFIAEFTKSLKWSLYEPAESSPHNPIVLFKETF
jgi:hypothetical protein